MVTYRSEKIIGLLRQMHKSEDGVKATVVVNINGLLIESFPPSEDNSTGDQVAALTATLIGLAESTLRRLAQGEVERKLLEGGDGVMVIYPAGTEAALAVLVKKETKLGTLFYAVKRTAESIAEILGE